jgi:adenylylsulfate kinase
MSSPAGTGLTLWFTGLSAAGKSTVSRLVERELRAQGRRVELLDGDIVRTHLSKGLGYSPEDRATNIRRIAFVADLLSRNGVVVIVAVISPFRALRDEARAMMGERFVEVYVDAPVEVCAKRDPKGLYEKARRGEIADFTGVSQPYEEPGAPEIHLHTDSDSPAESARQVIEYLRSLAVTAPAGA